MKVMTRDKIVAILTTDERHRWFNTHNVVSDNTSRIAWWMDWHQKAGTDTTATYAVAVLFCCLYRDLKRANVWLTLFQANDPLPYMIMANYDQSSCWLIRYRVLRLRKSLPSPEAKIGSAMQLLSKKKDLLTLCVSLFVGCMIGHMFDT